MKLKSILLTLIYFALGATAWAANQQCEKAVISSQSSIDERHLQLLSTVESELNAWLPEELRIPKVQVQVFANTTESYALTSEPVPWQIHIGTKRFQQGGDLVLTGIFAHEYGHWVFANYFGPDFLYVRPEREDNKRRLKGRLNKDPDYKELFEKVNELRHRFSELNKLPSSKEKERKISNLFRRISDWEKRLHMTPAYLRYLRDMDQFLGKSGKFSGYNELFADTVAYLFTNQPSIMADQAEFIKPTSGEDFDHALINRAPNQPLIRRNDFLALVSFKSWNWDPVHFRNRYTQFDPVRAALFKIIQKHNIPQDQYPKILIAFLRATKEHANQYDVKTYDELYALDIVKLNQEFFALILKHMRALNLF